MKESKVIQMVLIAQFISKVVTWMTNPVIMVYFIHRVSSDVMSVANLAGAITAFMLLDRLQRRSTINWLLDHYPIIAIGNVVAFAVTNVACMGIPWMRMVLNDACASVVKDLVDRVWGAKFNRLKTGDARSILEAQRAKYKRAGKFLGSLLATTLLAHSVISIQVAVGIMVLETIATCIVLSVLFAKLPK